MIVPPQVGIPSYIQVYHTCIHPIASHLTTSKHLNNYCFHLNQAQFFDTNLLVSNAFQDWDSSINNNFLQPQYLEFYNRLHCYKWNQAYQAGSRLKDGVKRKHKQPIMSHNGSMQYMYK